MTKAEKAIRAALAAGPTPGPWDKRHSRYEPEAFDIVATGIGALSLVKSEANAHLIAACNPENIAALLADRDEREAKVREERDALRKAMLRIIQCFPTDSDMYEAGWSDADVNEACDAHDAALAALAAKEK